MNPDPRADLAQRIHLLLRRELGQGIDPRRLLTETLYARDVLLVCDALPGPGLAALAQQFRQGTPDDGTISDWSADSSGFGSSVNAGPPAALAHAPRHWLSPGRWLGLR